MKTKTEATYYAKIGSWNGACYETDEVVEFYGTEAAALEWAESLELDLEYDTDYDVQITLEDEDGDVIRRFHCEYSAAKERQDSMDATWQAADEFHTDHLGYDSADEQCEREKQ